MGVTTEIRSDGSMVVSRFDKNQQVFLPRDSVVVLASLQNEANKCVVSMKENKWLLGEEKNHLFLQTSMYQNEMLVHLRIWWQNQPTKQGVTMSACEWYHFLQLLEMDAEATLGLSVLQNMLSSALAAIIKSQCEGCVQNYLSQSDHPCLMDPLTTANVHIDGQFDKLNVYQFIVKLAEKAAESNVIIKRPFDTFNILRGTKEEEIKMNALSAYKY